MIKFDAEFKSDEIFKVFKNATPKFFRKAGAYIRRIAQNSIKRKNDPDKHSPAGKPPFYHGTAMGGGLNFKQSILFSATKDSVVIGPIANRLGALGALHEYGGNQEIEYVASERFGHVFKVGERGPISTAKFANVQGRRIHGYFDPLTGYPVIDAPLTTTRMAAHATRVNSRVLSKYFTKSKIVSYPARPFMRPAFSKSQPYLMQLFKETL